MGIDYVLLNIIKANYSNNNMAEDKASIIADLQSTMQNELTNNFISDFDVKIGMPKYRRTAIVNFTREIVIALKDERFKEAVYDSLAVSMYTYPGECKTGDYITIKERNEDVTYLVRAKPDQRINHDKAMLLNCQFNLNILDDNGMTVRKYPIFFQDNKSRPGISERSETGVTEKSTFQAYLRHDEYSRRFVDVTGTTAAGKSNKISRILVNGLAYDVVGSDPVSMRGLLTLGLELSNKTPNDNLELGIADYYNNVTPTPSENLILGDADLWIGDTNNYNIVTNNTVTWGLTDNSVIATLGLTGINGECTVNCISNTALIGKILTLTATLDTGTKYTKIITITSRI